jgi:hypothetical protein
MAGLSNLHISIVPLNGMACSKFGIGGMFKEIGLCQIGNATRIVGLQDGNTTIAYKHCNGSNAPMSYMEALHITTSYTINAKRSLRQMYKRQGES